MKKSRFWTLEKYLYRIWWPLGTFKRLTLRKISDFIDGKIIPYLRIGSGPMEGFQVTMFCPECKHRLFYIECKTYETLFDHACDPNGAPLAHPAFICANGKCSKNIETEIFYGMDGSMYGGSWGTDRKYWAAIGSWKWWYDRTHRRKNQEDK